MAIKLRIKVGSIEVDYEGEEAWFKTEVLPMVTTISELQPVSVNSSYEDSINTSMDGNSFTDTSSKGASIQLTTSSIAHKLDVKSGPELVIAACAHLTFVLGKDAFSRQEILQDMQSATSFYEASHSKNLTATLDRLIKNDKLIERAKGMFVLHVAQRRQLESILAS